MYTYTVVHICIRTVHRIDWIIHRMSHLVWWFLIVWIHNWWSCLFSSFYNICICRVCWISCEYYTANWVRNKCNVQMSTSVTRHYHWLESKWIAMETIPQYHNRYYRWEWHRSGPADHPSQVRVQWNRGWVWGNFQEWISTWGDSSSDTDHYSRFSVSSSLIIEIMWRSCNNRYHGSWAFNDNNKSSSNDNWEYWYNRKWDGWFQLCVYVCELNV